MNPHIILHLEDNANIRESTKLVFGSYLCEYESISKENPSQAFASIDNKEFSIDDIAIILTDYFMEPGNSIKGNIETGLDAAKGFRKRNYSGPIIVMTALGEILTDEELSNFNDRINKPYNIDDLVDKIKKYTHNTSKHILTRKD